LMSQRKNLFDLNPLLFNLICDIFVSFIRINVDLEAISLLEFENTI